MRHNKPYRKLSRQRSHYRALMRNLAFSLFEHERIETTMPKAKEARGFVDKIISLAKAGSLHDRRRAMALMGNKIIHTNSGKKIDIVGKVFDDIAPRLKNRNGGYTRIMRLARDRAGDCAPMVIFELVDRVEKVKKTSETATSDSDEASASTTKKATKAKKKKAE